MNQKETHFEEISYSILEQFKPFLFEILFKLPLQFLLRRVRV